MKRWIERGRKDDVVYKEKRRGKEERSEGKEGGGRERGVVERKGELGSVAGRQKGREEEKK